MTGGAARTAAPEVGMALAAGFGTRMRPLTERTPKPLLRVAGRTLLDRTLDRLEEVGVRRAVVNAHYLADQIAAHIERRSRPTLALSLEPDMLLETGGGVAKALPILAADAFWVANSDNIWIGPRAFAPLSAGWRPERMDALLLLTPTGSTRGHTRPGDFDLSTEGRLIRRGDKPSAAFVYTGAQILTRRAFDHAPTGPFSLNLIWDRLIAAGRAFGVVHRGGWIDVGSPEGLAEADDVVGAWPRPTIG